MEATFRKKIHDVIFETNTRGGKLFDILLVITILISIAVVIIDSIPDMSDSMHRFLNNVEWVITFIFTAEYILRIISIKRSQKYIFSFYGIIDLLATIPSYLALFMTGGSSLLVIRALRLIRIFRILKLSRYTSAGFVLRKSLSASKAKIGVFLLAVAVVVLVIGTIMYLIEGDVGGFTSIPKGIYWTIVTITTVGYGDIAPVTGLGQFIASLTMLTGYAIIAVPTGIVSAEISQQNRLIKNSKTRQITCNDCLSDDHALDAKYCKRCGAFLQD
ncbi:MAG: ion transporter [Bacteroidales bacterium]|nr:ion transporter [Bacteroidales bacterium]